MTSRTAVVIYGLKEISALDVGYGQSRLTFRSTGRNSVSVYSIPARLADMIVEAFHEYEDWLSGQEGPAFDEALGAKCDAEARATKGD